MSIISRLFDSRCDDHDDDDDDNAHDDDYVKTEAEALHSVMMGQLHLTRKPTATVTATATANGTKRKVKNIKKISYFCLFCLSALYLCLPECIYVSLYLYLLRTLIRF